MEKVKITIENWNCILKEEKENDNFCYNGYAIQIYKNDAELARISSVKDDNLDVLEWTLEMINKVEKNKIFVLKRKNQNMIKKIILG